MSNRVITTIIVDDQRGCIEVLKKDLSSYCDIRVVETCASVNEAKEAVLNYQPMLMFLDVEMPLESGFQFLQEIRASIHWQMCVVFYSAYDKYILPALRASAIDFLLKPYRPEELTEIVERIRNKIGQDTNDLDQAVQQLLNAKRKIALHTSTALSLFRKEEILYFEYSNGVWVVALTDGTSHRLKLNTKSKEISDISSSFVQVSPDCIINIDYLVSIENRTLRCVFFPPISKKEIYVTRRNYPKVKNILDIL
jgi:two-component system LytT family response regulator